MKYDLFFIKTNLTAYEKNSVDKLKHALKIIKYIYIGIKGFFLKILCFVLKKNVLQIFAFEKK